MTIDICGYSESWKSIQIFIYFLAIISAVFSEKAEAASFSSAEINENILNG